MGLSGYQLVSDGALEVTEQHLQSCCSWCDLVYPMYEMEDGMYEMEHVLRGMKLTSDLQSHQDVLATEILGKQQQSQSKSQLSEPVKQMRILRGILVFPNPFPDLTAARQAVCEAHRTSYSSYCTWEQIIWWRGVPQKSKTGSKRGLRETEYMFLQHFHGYCGPSISVAQSKRSKHFRGSNPDRKDANGEESIKSTDKASICNYYKDEYICKYTHDQEVTPMPSLDSVLGNEVCKSSASTILIILDLPVLRWLRKRKRSESAKRKRVVLPSKKPAVTGWGSLPYDLQENILQRVEFKDLFRFKILSKACKKHIESDAFRQWRGATSSREGSFTAINYYIKNKAWQCTGYDLNLKMWRSLPTFSCLPTPDADLFKEYSVCGHGGLMCADVSKLPKKGELVVFNPLTGKKRALPPLLYPRNPVLVHISVDSATQSYKVVVAGSSTASDKHLSRKIEVFDSKSSQWKERCDLPGPAFGLNEHQAGVCVNGILYFIAFMEGDCHRGVVAFDLENGKWMENMACPIPFSLLSNTLQLVESNGKVYLFSEQERGGFVEHCIDVLEFSNPNAGAVEKCHWKNVVRVKKSGGRGLQVYPEHTCVGFGEGKLCVFNTLNRDGVVYDMQDGRQCEVLQPPPPDQKGDNFFSLNPVSFTLQPSFDSDPKPRSIDAI